MVTKINNVFVFFSVVRETLFVVEIFFPVEFCIVTEYDQNILAMFLRGAVKVMIWRFYLFVFVFMRCDVHINE